MFTEKKNKIIIILILIFDFRREKKKKKDGGVGKQVWKIKSFHPSRQVSFEFGSLKMKETEKKKKCQKQIFFFNIPEKWEKQNNFIY